MEFNEWYEYMSKHFIYLIDRRDEHGNLGLTCGDHMISFQGGFVDLNDESAWRDAKKSTPRVKDLKNKMIRSIFEKSVLLF